MSLSSPRLDFDNRLLAIEELLRQKQVQAAVRELGSLSESDFQNRDHELGLLCALKAEASYHDSNYKAALESGLRAAKLFADLPQNKRYGQIQLILARSYAAIGDFKNSEIRSRDALASFRRAGEDIGQVDALNELARVAFMRCDYPQAIAFLTDALEKVGGNIRKKNQITGNLGRIQVHTGHWAEAETALNTAIGYDEEHHEEFSLAVNVLSLGYLHLRRRHFAQASKCFERAKVVIGKNDYKRLQVIALEYLGEMALEREDNYRAKSVLSDAYQKSLLMAPGSALVSQSARRLAEADFALDNLSEAMKYGQKALEISTNLGERAEIALSRRIIARVHSANGRHADAVESVRQSLELLRQVADQYELGRTLLIAVEICTRTTGYEELSKMLLDEGSRIFKKMRLDYWLAESDCVGGIAACQSGDLSSGFRRLSRAERIFTTLDEHNRVKQVHKFLLTLGEQAVALSVSQMNEFKIFGNVVSQAEYAEFKTGLLEEILALMLRQTGAGRALIYVPSGEGTHLVASCTMTPDQSGKFVATLNKLLGQEISKSRPTLLLDCRRDPNVNELFVGQPSSVASLIVVPFLLADKSMGYLYLDRPAVDNSLNPFNQAELNFAVGFSDIISFKWMELQKNRLADDNRRLKMQLMESSAFPNILTRNEKMQELLAQVRQIVNSNISVSIEGETGSGKDLVARAIHYNSSRRDKRFISVNCAALPETLLESELFGYKRGAFTGADRDKAGLFEEANGGTFFLDEIGDMPLSIQSKILRILETQEVIRLGETVPRKVDVRIISATNKDLKEQMELLAFRQDLYYRLSAFTLHLPSLRERKEDIPLLVSHFLSGSGKTVSPAVMRLLLDYGWPGNIRELENEVKRMVLLSGDGPEISVESVSPKVVKGVNGSASAAAPPMPATMEFSATYSLYDFLSTHEKQFIVKALRDSHCVKKHAAEKLNIPESTLRLKIKQYDIDLDGLSAVN
jgi:transcriptional regulator with GAF, ATPase, and Fis domain